jgi:hypothetical protein
MFVSDADYKSASASYPKKNKHEKGCLIKSEDFKGSLSFILKSFKGKKQQICNSYCPAFSILAQESFRVEIRLKTSFPGLES